MLWIICMQLVNHGVSSSLVEKMRAETQKRDWGIWAALHCFWGAETWLGIRLYHIHSPNSFEKTPPVPQIIASPIQVFSALSIFFFFIFSHTTHQLLIQRFVHLTILQWCCIAKDTLEVYLTEVKNLTLKMLDQMAK